MGQFIGCYWQHLVALLYLCSQSGSLLQGKAVIWRTWAQGRLGFVGMQCQDGRERPRRRTGSLHVIGAGEPENLLVTIMPYKGRLIDVGGVCLLSHSLNWILGYSMPVWKCKWRREKR